MQLIPACAAALALTFAAACAGSAAAQSLAPMHASGFTPSDVKGFRLIVGNPYRRLMSFRVVPMDRDFAAPAAAAMVNAPTFRLAPGASRPVIVEFRIDPQLKERTIGVCVLPNDLAGPVLPRVCGTYTGRRLAGAGR